VTYSFFRRCLRLCYISLIFLPILELGLVSWL
jgi:hypothetical protein